MFSYKIIHSFFFAKIKSFIHIHCNRKGRVAIDFNAADKVVQQLRNCTVI